jgi:hypothetical protein
VSARRGPRRAVLTVARHLLGTGSALLVLAGSPGGAAAATPEHFSAWPEQSALTLAPDRIVVGLFSQSSWGVNARVELRVHPVWFWVMPHAEVKLRWLDAGHLQLASTHRLAYPTPLLALVSREGSGGLLPATTDVPYALIADSDVVGSAEWYPRQWLSARLGVSVAIQGGGDEILLDFPFLYQRFAALAAPAVPKLALSANGEVLERLSYALEFRHYWLPLTDFPLLEASEYAGELYFQLATAQRLGLGARLSVAHLPIGWRSHLLPFVDYQLRF